jgi:hypothetical protein
VWEPLIRLMPIECAHVRDGDKFMGCISNWPGVMVQTRCNERGIKRGRPDDVAADADADLAAARPVAKPADPTAQV